MGYQQAFYNPCQGRQAENFKPLSSFVETVYHPLYTVNGFNPGVTCNSVV